MNVNAIQYAIRSSKTGVTQRGEADAQLGAVMKRLTALETENAAMRGDLARRDRQGVSES